MKEITIAFFINSVRIFTKTLHKTQKVLAYSRLFSSIRSDFFAKLLLVTKFGPCTKSVPLKAYSGERCAPCNFVLLLTLGGTRVRFIVYLAVHQMK